MLKLIKEIREETGAGVVDIKKALEESSGDKEKALNILKKSGLEKADKKANRIAGEGVIVSYIHADGKSGAMLKLLCETDFVAKNSDFNDLANDIAMQIVAMSPIAVLPEDITNEMLTEDIDNLKMSGLKGKELTARIEEIRKEKALYSQSFVKNPDMTIEELIKGKIAAIGENIKVDKFVKMDI
jgi:elongation factor Ts